MCLLGGGACARVCVCGNDGFFLATVGYGFEDVLLMEFMYPAFTRIPVFVVMFV